jgi:hypothetical protein
VRSGDVKTPVGRNGLRIQDREERGSVSEGLHRCVFRIPIVIVAALQESCQNFRTLLFEQSLRVHDVVGYEGQLHKVSHPAGHVNRP